MMRDDRPSLSHDLTKGHMLGPEILTNTMSVARRVGTFPLPVNYHPRSDRHSLAACFGIMFDLLETCALLRQHVSAGKVAFGVNHLIRDFQQNKSKKLDLVLCTPQKRPMADGLTLAAFGEAHEIQLSPDHRDRLARLPPLVSAPVGAVLVSLEAKAAMTEFGKAGPRLYDELNSSHQITHGSSSSSLAVGFAMINVAAEYISPTRNLVLRSHPDSPITWSHHRQPADAARALATVKRLPRRSRSTQEGFDALAVVMVDCRNDGSRVSYHTDLPAPQPGEVLHYESMIQRTAAEYSTTFRAL